VNESGAISQRVAVRDAEQSVEDEDDDEYESIEA